MKQNVKQKLSDELSSDACPNRAGLFALASDIAFLAKLGRGGDFYFNERGARGQVILDTASESMLKQNNLYNRFAH